MVFHQETTASNPYDGWNLGAGELPEWSERLTADSGQGENSGEDDYLDIHIASKKRQTSRPASSPLLEDECEPLGQFEDLQHIQNFLMESNGPQLLPIARPDEGALEEQYTAQHQPSPEISWSHISSSNVYPLETSEGNSTVIRRRKPQKFIKGFPPRSEPLPLDWKAIPIEEIIWFWPNHLWGRVLLRLDEEKCPPSEVPTYMHPSAKDQLAKKDPTSFLRHWILEERKLTKDAEEKGKAVEHDGLKFADVPHPPANPLLTPYLGPTRRSVQHDSQSQLRDPQSLESRQDSCSPRDRSLQDNSRTNADLFMSGYAAKKRYLSVAESPKGQKKSRQSGGHSLTPIQKQRSSPDPIDPLQALPSTPSHDISPFTQFATSINPSQIRHPGTQPLSFVQQDSAQDYATNLAQNQSSPRTRPLHHAPTCESQTDANPSYPQHNRSRFDELSRESSVFDSEIDRLSTAPEEVSENASPGQTGSSAIKQATCIDAFFPLFP